MDEPRQTMELHSNFSPQNHNAPAANLGVVVAEENATQVATEVATQVATRPDLKRDTKRKRQPKYNVLLWDDDQHSYEYVIDMMQKVFGHATGKGLRIAFEVDKQGVAICLTTTMEHAELKCQQILSFGRDGLIATSVGSMKSTIEPVEVTG